MPNSRLLQLESRDPHPGRRVRVRTTGAGHRTTLALGAVALATALTLVGAPAAEALGLL